MLGKLFKYDMKWVLKIILPFVIMCFGSSILCRIFYELKNTSFIFNVLYLTTVVITNMLIVGLLFNVVVRNIIKFKEQIYGDESYLIHTLPVERNDIIKSKILSSIVSIFISLIIIMMCLCIEFLNLSLINMINDTFNNISNSYETNSTFLLISLISYITLSVIWIVEMIYSSIILGHRKNNKKILYSFIYIIVFYFLMEITNLIFIGVFALFNSNMFQLLATNEMLPSVIKPFIISFLIINTIYVIVYYIICIKSINKKLNID